MPGFEPRATLVGAEGSQLYVTLEASTISSPPLSLFLLVILPKNTIWSFNHFYSKHGERNITWNGPFQFHLTGIFGTCFEGGPLWSVRLSRSVGRNVPFHLTKLSSPVLLFCILLTATITKRAVAWVGSVQPECPAEGTVPLSTWNFQNFKPEFLLNGKRPSCTRWALPFCSYFDVVEKGLNCLSLFSDHFHMFMLLLF